MDEYNTKYSYVCSYAANFCVLVYRYIHYAKVRTMDYNYVVLYCARLSQKSTLSLELGSWLACSSCSIARPAQTCAHRLASVPAALAGTAIEAVAGELMAISQRAELSPPSASTPSTAAPGSLDAPPARSLVHTSALLSCANEECKNEEQQIFVPAFLKH